MLDAEFKSLVGKTLVDVKNKVDELVLSCSDGSEYLMYHSQDCCESVTVEDICGDLADIIGTPIVRAEESRSDRHPDDKKDRDGESFTWTFYKIDTAKGGVTIRWYGSSNGYYSESVDFMQTKAANAEATATAPITEPQAK